jgi:hypothetical protein
MAALVSAVEQVVEAAEGVDKAAKGSVIIACLDSASCCNRRIFDGVSSMTFKRFPSILITGSF